MYYLKLIQLFWEFNKIAKISTSEISLYFYLLKIGYENERYDFKISDVELGKELGLTRKTIKSTKEKLKSSGLIQFQTINGLHSHYRLLLNYAFKIESENLFENKKTNINKLQQIEIFETSYNIPPPQSKIAPEIIVFKNDAKLSFENLQPQKPEVKLKLEQKQKELENDKNPSLNEFMGYAKSLENYESELDLSIIEKYESWRNNGWKNTSNRPIKNWKLSLKSILPYLKDNIEENFLSLQDIPKIKRPES